MAKGGKRAAKISAWDDRDLRQLQRLREKYGPAECKRQIDKCPPGAKRGRPRNDFFSDFSLTELPEKGLYLVRFTLKDGHAALAPGWSKKFPPPLFCVIVRPKKHRLKPGGPGKTGAELKYEKQSGRDYQYPTTLQAFREIAETILKAPEEMTRDPGRDADAIARRLARDLRAVGRVK